MTTPHQGRTPSPSFTPTPRAWRAAAAATLLALLAACGGGGGGGSTGTPTPGPQTPGETPGTGNTPTPAPAPSTGTRTLAGPAQAPALTDTCADNPGRDGDAQRACYFSASEVGDYRLRTEMRSDKLGGLLVWTVPDTARPSEGRLARISPSGARTTLAMPVFNGAFDVASDGTVWMIHTYTDTPGGEIRTLDRQGSTRVVARFSGSNLAPNDGPLPDTLDGTVSDLAAGRDRVFLRQTVNGTLRLTQLRRNDAGAWQLSAVPTPLQSQGTLRIRSDEQNRLWLLLDDATRTPLSSTGAPYLSALELWRWSEDAGWQYRGGTRYNTASVYYRNPSRDLNITDFSLRPDGSALVSGGYTGRLYAIDPLGQWQVLIEREGKSPLQMLQTGPVAQIPVDGVFGASALPDGRIAFLDRAGNRIQVLDGTTLSVLSGESWSAASAWQRFANMRLLGFFADGRLLLYPLADRTGINPGVIGFQPLTGAFELLQEPDRYGPVVCDGSALSRDCGVSVRTIAASSAYQPAHVSMSQEAAPRVFLDGAGLVQWQGPGTKGSLASDASGGDSVRATDANTSHLYRLMQRMNGPFGVYRLPLAGGAWEVVAAARDAAGRVPDSTVYGRAVDLSTLADAKHLAVRADGGLWLANDSMLWLVSKTGELRLVAGRARPDAATPEAAVDSADGAAVRFGQIERIRALPDGHALVVDSAGHAVRSVTEQGQSATLVGTLNQSGAATAALPGRLNQPVDALATAGVLYITEKNNPQMSRVAGLLP